MAGLGVTVLMVHLPAEFSSEDISLHTSETVVCMSHVGAQTHDPVM